MLSRVAEALFWIGRYVERAEDTARLLDVHFHDVLEDPEVDEAAPAAVVADRDGAADDRRRTAHGARGARAARLRQRQPELDRRRRSAPPGRTPAARGRRSRRRSGSASTPPTTRCRGRVAAAREFGPAPFFSYVRERAAMLAGYVDGDHEPGRRLRLPGARPQPRAGRHDGPPARRRGRARPGPRGHVADDAAGVLGARGLPADLPARASRSAWSLEFLLLDRLFPRSVFHALTVGENALARLEPPVQRTVAALRRHRPARCSAGSRTDLEFLQPEQLLEDLPERLHRVAAGHVRPQRDRRQELFATARRRRLEPRGVAAMSEGMVHQ